MRNDAMRSWVPTICRASSGLPFVLALLTAAFLPPDDCLAQAVGGSATTPSSKGAAWVPTGNLNLPRSGHTATKLLDGKVLVVGGQTNVDPYAPATWELYDPGTGTWSAQGTLNLPRMGHTATLLPDGRVMAMGGCSQKPPLGRCSPVPAELYDPDTMTWSLTPFPITNLFYAPAILLPSGKVLMVDGGGSGFGTRLFDPVTAAWSSAGHIFGYRFYFSATLLQDGQVLAAGGTSDPDDGLGVATAELYEPGTGTWKLTGTMNVARTDHTATLLAGGKVLAAGGGTTLNATPGSINLVRVAELFDAVTGTWAPTGNLNTARVGHTATALPNGEVLIAAGSSGTSPISSAEIYDPASATFRTTASLSLGRFGHTATLLANGKVLVAGGDGRSSSNSLATLASAELYEPGAAIGAGFTGSWFNPGQNGHGIALEVLPGEPSRLLASWFTFAPHGGQSWIVGLGPINGNQAVLQGYQSAGLGGRFPPNFDAANVHQERWGTLTFAFSDCNHGRVDWVSSAPDYGSGGMDLTRLTLPAGLTCSP